jgi:hypothetical protein
MDPETRRLAQDLLRAAQAGVLLMQQDAGHDAHPPREQPPAPSAP